MKALFTTVIVVICAAVLFIGHSYWNKRITASPETMKQAVASASQENGKSADPAPAIGNLLAKSQNWPKSAQDQFKQALQQNKPFKILFVGSTALGSKDEGMLKDVVQQLTDAYGSSHLEVTVHTYDVTSKGFLAKNGPVEMAAEKAQLVVFEPFILNDNGQVAIGDALNNLTKVIGDVTAANPGTTFILQPSYPLFGAKFYPGQVAKLKEYAAKNQIAYLDHWTAWPPSTDKALNAYLTPNQDGPSEKGNQVWSQYLLNYLIHQ